MSDMTFNKQTARFLAAIGDNMPPLSARTMQEWIDNPLVLSNALGVLLSGPNAGQIVDFKVWKTLSINSGLPTADLLSGLRADKVVFCGYAESILEERVASNLQEESFFVNVVLLTVDQLGFRNGATREQIYRRIKDIGLTYCPFSLAVHLRQLYMEQPVGESILIGMLPVATKIFHACIFCVERQEHFILSTRYVAPDIIFDKDTLWAFVQAP